jgi:hypothetical protein
METERDEYRFGLASGHCVLSVHFSPELAAGTDLAAHVRGAALVEATPGYLLGVADGEADAFAALTGAASFDRHGFIVELRAQASEATRPSDYQAGYLAGYAGAERRVPRRETSAGETWLL